MPSNNTTRDMEGGGGGGGGGPGETDSLLGRSRRKVKRLGEGFIDFAFQGNILQIAFGLILAATFTDMVKSFVNNILMPPISIILPLNKNMDEKFAILKAGPNFNKSAKYNTPQQARDDGAVVMAYGTFVNQIVNFVMIGFALYGLALTYTMLSHDPIIKHTIKCKYCRQRINEKCKRCIHCTSWLDGREERVH